MKAKNIVFLTITAFQILITTAQEPNAIVVASPYILSRYHVLKTYDQAKAACNATNSWLVEIKNTQIQDAIKGLIGISGRLRSYWIGATDQEVEGEWKWNDGTPLVYTNWNDGQPDDLSSDEDCLSTIHGTPQWNDVSCSIMRMGYICQSDLVSLSPHQQVIAVVKGDSITISMNVTTYDGLVCIRIYKEPDTTPLQTKDNIGNQTVSFQLGIANESFAVLYRFEASANFTAYTVRGTAEITENVGVTITNVSPLNIIAPVTTGPDRVNCTAYGIPTPAVQWIKDGVTVSMSNTNIVHQTIQTTAAMLWIENAKKLDAGTYTCRATNTIGHYQSDVTEERNVTLTVYGQATITNVEVVNCTVLGQFNVHWSPDIDTININHRFTMKVNNDNTNIMYKNVTPTTSTVTTSVTGLQPNTLYKILIEVCPDLCISPSNEVTKMTAFGLPSLVKNAQIDSTICELSWSLPSTIPVEEITGFTIDVIATFRYLPFGITEPTTTISNNLTSNISTFLIPTLPNRIYTAKIYARTCAGFGSTANAKGSCITQRTGFLNAQLDKILTNETFMKQSPDVVLPEIEEVICNPKDGDKITLENSNRVMGISENLQEGNELSNDNKIDLLKIYECLQEIVGMPGRIQPGPGISLTVIRTERNESIVYKDSLATNNTEANVSCVIPASTVNKVYGKTPDTGNGLSSFIFHADNGLYVTTSKFNQFHTFSIKFGNHSLKNLPEPIKYNISLPPKKENMRARWIRCGYYSIEKRDWFFDGCEFVEHSNSNECQCSHTTNFALIAQVHPMIEWIYLDNFSKFACLLPVLSLALLLLIYLSNRQLRESRVNQIHVFLSSTLLLFYLTFLIAVDMNGNPASCTATAFILQFTLLSSWGWITVECIGLYRKCVLKSEFSEGFVYKSALSVYLLSAALTTTTFTVAQISRDNDLEGWKPSVEDNGDSFFSYYRSSEYCWLTEYSLYFGILLPVFAMMTSNTVTAIITIKKIDRNTEISSTRKEDHNNLMIVLTLSTLLGLPWILAIPLLITDDEYVNIIFSVLFSIANALQGFIIFLLLCVRQEEVRKMWWKPQWVTQILPKKVGTSSSDTKPTILPPVSSNVN